MKPKILFYGNCQIEALAGLFSVYSELKDKFEVIDNRNFLGMPGGKICVSNFMLTPGNYDEKQLDTMVEMADIIVFQSMNTDHLNRPEHACTDKLLENFQGQLICVPSFWYTGYLQHPYREYGDGFFMLEVFYWLYSQGYSDKEAYNILKNESLPIAKPLHEYYHKASIEGIRDRMNKNLEKYDCIDIIPWITENYNKQLITHSNRRPALCYIEYLLHDILKRLNCDVDFIDIYKHIYKPLQNDFHYVGPEGFFLPTEFRWFNELFPDLKPLNELESNMYVWPYKRHELEEFSNMGMEKVRNKINENTINTFDIPSEVLGIINNTEQ